MKKLLEKFITMWLLFGVSVTVFGLSNEDVVKMHLADLSDETIIVAISSEKENDFDTSALKLIDLKNAGLSEEVIQAMILDGEPRPVVQSQPKKPTGINFKDVPSEKVMPPVIQPEKGGKYYTRINFWYEGNSSASTNYSRGIMVPINTEVELVTVKSKEFSLRLASGNTVEIENISKYTLASVEELMSRYLADRPTKIDLYEEVAARQISSGVLRLGMTKDQVLLTRGYPPFHATVSLESDRWVYWSSRFVKQTLVFADGRLVEGRGLM